MVALAQVRLVKFPLMGGVAYVHHGPLWRGRETDAETASENLRQIVRALRNEYASRRGLFLRVLPYAYDGFDGWASIIESEQLQRTEPQKRTYCVDLTPSLADVRKTSLADGGPSSIAPRKTISPWSMDPPWTSSTSSSGSMGI